MCGAVVAVVITWQCTNRIIFIWRFFCEFFFFRLCLKPHVPLPSCFVVLVLVWTTPNHVIKPNENQTNQRRREEKKESIWSSRLTFKMRTHHVKSEPSLAHVNFVRILCFFLFLANTSTHQVHDTKAYTNTNTNTNSVNSFRPLHHHGIWESWFSIKFTSNFVHSNHLCTRMRCLCINTHCVCVSVCCHTHSLWSHWAILLLFRSLTHSLYCMLSRSFARSLSTYLLLCAQAIKDRRKKNGRNRYNSQE